MVIKGRGGAAEQAWVALGGVPEVARRVRYRGAGGFGDGPLPVRELARAAVGVCSLAAAELDAVRAGRDEVPEVVVDEGAVATAFVSERHLRVDGRAPVVFAPLSGFWRAADGWVRTHANYPHHRAALVRVLGLTDGSPDGSPEGSSDELAAAVAGRKAAEVQEAVYAGGGLAVAVAGRYGAPQPLVERVSRMWGDRPRALPQAPEGLPMAGLRVLDLTRVIAGPVATRTLGLLGADVLRIDSPRLPEADDAHADTGFGKRSARLDLADPADRAVFDRLLDEADVVVTGYRPGTLDRYGLGAEELLDRRPGLVVAQLCAWGWSGEWAGRRGFDSLVQAGYGISAAYAAPDGTPGVLPAQALDHGTGYLVAAGVMRALSAGGGRSLRFSLAGTASWLVRDLVREDTPPAGEEAHAPDPWLREADSAYGRLRYAAPPVAFGPGDWSRTPSRWGTDAPVWL
ncbi:CoA transferase [Streptomyces sp. NPDC048603]|uniref:CoA transferase n=1 Tax=Streptomyces sp. NPDC048603 TaxID=3365577 RepID=UPI0037127F2B